MKEVQVEFEEQIEQLKSYLVAEDINSFRESFLELHVYEQSQVYLSLSKDERLRAYNFLSPNEMADTFEILEEEEESVEKYLEEMNPQYAANMLSEMYRDNAADMLNQLEPYTIKKYLSLMPKKAADGIKKLLKYEDDTAGSIMTTEYISIIANQTIQSAMAILKKKAPEAETIYYVYVVDANRKLVGVISLRDLIVHEDDEMISDIMGDRLISVNGNDDQRDVARTMQDYDFLAIPVVDDEERLIGIITVDDIMDVISDEAASDYSGLAGVDVEERSENPFVVASKRLPWLIILLFLGIGTSTLISNYEEMISKASILAVFISLITGTAGNAGTQSLAVAVRKLADNDENKRNFKKLIISEIASGLITGVVTGATIFLAVGIWKENFVLGSVIGIAMLVAITIANLAGSFIPILMERIGFDPAVASGPFITTLTDLTSVLIYFNIAALFMEYLV
ncbi:magnesium transporter [Carnobacterium sp. ISL-102]|uniref:magnesium transporter n=1 Tax=Carnobacterium sp. ISL-102 TaxID=2819142 RepID=UPI0025540BAA|nr:magnesium transporter [Carnobacterium sp. ISL-102]